MLAAILQKILWNPIISYLYLFLCFYEYLKTFSYKIKNFQTEGLYVEGYLFSIFVVVDRCLLYSKTSRQIGAVEALLPSVNKHKNH